MSETIEFLSKVHVKAFAKNEKRWQKLPEEWSKTGRRENTRIVTRKENTNPEVIYTVIGKRQMSEGFTEYDNEYGYLWNQKSSVTVYIVADRLHKRHYALIDDLELINGCEENAI